MQTQSESTSVEFLKLLMATKCDLDVLISMHFGVMSLFLEDIHNQ